MHFIFNIEYTLFKELQYFFLRFAAPKELNILMSIPVLNKTVILHTNDYGYFYHETIMDSSEYQKVICENNIEWIEYEVQILDHVKNGSILANCDAFTTSQQFAVISDIDDSIKITNVTAGITAMMKSTFNPFKAVPLMNITYSNFKSMYKNVNFHYVSSSPYVLYNKLESFIFENNFPIGSLHLRVSHLENFSFFTMLRSSKVTKPSTINDIIKSYPKRKYVLVGDSAENDAEIYAHIYHQYPQNIHKILIRCASTTEAVCVQKVQNAITNYNVPSNVMDYFANDSSDIQQKIFGY